MNQIDGRKLVARSASEATTILYTAVLMCVLAKVMNVNWSEFRLLGLSVHPDENLFRSFLNVILIYCYVSFILHLHSEITSDSLSIIHKSEREVADFIRSTSGNNVYSIEMREKFVRLMSYHEEIDEQKAAIIAKSFFDNLPQWRDKNIKDGTWFAKKSSFSILSIHFLLPTIAYILAILA